MNAHNPQLIQFTTKPSYPPQSRSVLLPTFFKSSMKLVTREMLVCWGYSSVGAVVLFLSPEEAEN